MTRVRHARIAVIAAAAALVLALAGCSATAGASTPSRDAGTHPAAAGSAAGSAPAAGPAAAPGQPASTPNGEVPGRTITVTGTGTVRGTPDTLTVQLGVQTRAATASAALSENNAKAAAVIATLQKHGVAKKDLQTSQLSIDPTYASGGSTITGYQVSNMVTATLHDIAKAGAVVDAAQQAAGDAIRLDQVGFSFSDDSALRATARTDAVKQALTQARQLAAAAGVTLGAVQSITDEPRQPSPQPTYDVAAPAAGAAAMPVEPGTTNLTVQVQVVVAIG